MKLIFNDDVQISYKGEIILTHNEIQKVWFHANRLMVYNMRRNETINTFKGMASESFANAMCELFPERFERHGENEHGDVFYKGRNLVIELKSETIAKKWGETGIFDVTYSKLKGPAAHHTKNIGEDLIVIHVMYDFVCELPTIVSIFSISNLVEKNWTPVSGMGTGFSYINKDVKDDVMKFLACVDDMKYIYNFGRIGYDVTPFLHVSDSQYKTSSNIWENIFLNMCRDKEYGQNVGYTLAVMYDNYLKEEVDKLDYKSKTIMLRTIFNTVVSAFGYEPKHILNRLEEN